MKPYNLSLQQMKKTTCNLRKPEAYIAFICIAIMFGYLGGSVALRIVEGNASDTTLYIAIGAFSFFFTHFASCILFPTARNFYGAKSWAHILYDFIGLGASYLVLL